ncbi:hypothetical protein ACC730_38230, partial [Rhizobium ruizarguesonis]
FKAIKMFEIQPGKERSAGAVQNQVRRLHHWKDPLVASGALPADRAAMVSSTLAGSRAATRPRPLVGLL